MVASDAPAGETRIVPTVTKAPRPRRRFISQIPASLAENPELLAALEALPANYNFEVTKTIWRLQQLKTSRAALQFPLGHAAVASLVMGAVSPAEVADQIAELSQPVPVALWAELKAEGLLAARRHLDPQGDTACCVAPTHRAAGPAVVAG